MNVEQISFPLHSNANPHHLADLTQAVNLIPEAFGAGWKLQEVDIANHRITAERLLP